MSEPYTNEYVWGLQEEIERLRESIAELEEAILTLAIPLDYDLDPTGCHIITHDQINAAWTKTEGMRAGLGKLSQVREALMCEFNIHRCEECGGSGAVVVDRDPDGRPYLDKCPVCDGRAWVIGGEDE